MVKESQQQKLMEAHLMRRVINMLGGMIEHKRNMLGYGLINYNTPQQMAQQTAQMGVPRKVYETIPPVARDVALPPMKIQPVPIPRGEPVLTQSDILHQEDFTPLPKPSDPGFFEDPLLYGQLQDYFKKDLELRKMVPGPGQILVKGKKKKKGNGNGDSKPLSEMSREEIKRMPASDISSDDLFKYLQGIPVSDPSSIGPKIENVVKSLTDFIKSEAEEQSKYVQPLHQKFAMEEAHRIPYKKFPAEESRQVQAHPKPYVQKIQGREYYENFSGGPGLPLGEKKGKKDYIQYHASKQKLNPKFGLRNPYSHLPNLPGSIEDELFKHVPYNPTHFDQPYIKELNLLAKSKYMSDKKHMEKNKREALRFAAEKAEKLHLKKEQEKLFKDAQKFIFEEQHERLSYPKRRAIVKNLYKDAAKFLEKDAKERGNGASGGKRKPGRPKKK